MPPHLRASSDSSNTGYNGWPNVETWSVYLWLTSSDPALATFVTALCHSAHGRSDVAEVLRTFVEDHNPLAGSDSLYGDLMAQSLRRVQWRAIAEEILHS